MSKSATVFFETKVMIAFSEEFHKDENESDQNALLEKLRSRMTRIIEDFFELSKQLCGGKEESIAFLRAAVGRVFESIAETVEPTLNSKGLEVLESFKGYMQNLINEKVEKLEVEFDSENEPKQEVFLKKMQLQMRQTIEETLQTAASWPEYKKDICKEIGSEIYLSKTAKEIQVTLFQVMMKEILENTVKDIKSAPDSMSPEMLKSFEKYTQNLIDEEVEKLEARPDNEEPN